MIQIEWAPEMEGAVHIICTFGTCSVNADALGVTAILHMVAHMQGKRAPEIPDGTDYTG